MPPSQSEFACVNACFDVLGEDSGVLSVDRNTNRHTVSSDFEETCLDSCSEKVISLHLDNLLCLLDGEVTYLLCPCVVCSTVDAELSLDES